MEVNDLLNDKLSALATKDDVETLKANIEKIHRENTELRNEIQELKVKNSNMQTKIEQMDKLSRRFNIVVSGLKCEDYTKAKTMFTELCARVLSLQVNVNKVIKLKMANDFIMELDSAKQVNDILFNSGKLKHTGVYVQRDLTAEERSQKYHLRQLKKSLQTYDQRLEFHFKGTTLYINNKPFRWQNENIVAYNPEDEMFIKKLVSESKHRRNTPGGRTLQETTRIPGPEYAATSSSTNM